jgi:hypothetical protein
MHVAHERHWKFKIYIERANENNLVNELPEKVWWHLHMGNCKKKGLLCWTLPRELQDGVQSMIIVVIREHGCLQETY